MKTLCVTAEEVLLREDIDHYGSSRPIQEGCELVTALSQWPISRLVLAVATEDAEAATYWARMNGFSKADIQIIRPEDANIEPWEAAWNVIQRVRAAGPIELVITAYPNLYVAACRSYQPVLLYGRRGRVAPPPPKVSWDDLQEQVKRRREAVAETNAREVETHMADKELTQRAPWPVELESLVAQVQYRPGWWVELLDIERDPGCGGLTLVITTRTIDSYHPDNPIRVAHYFPVPAATYNERSWRWWLFQRFLDVEAHECAEFFAIEGKRPYAPNHSPHFDPYMPTLEHTSYAERDTSFRGIVNHPEEHEEQEWEMSGEKPPLPSRVS